MNILLLLSERIYEIEIKMGMSSYPNCQLDIYGKFEMPGIKKASHYYLENRGGSWNWEAGNAILVGQMIFAFTFL